jgi:hypothetical protein
MKVSTIMDFHMVIEEDGAYPTILGRLWLIKLHVRNYWDIGYMTIGVHHNQQKILFINFVKSSERMTKYDDELETSQSSSFEGIFINDFSEKEMGLYALEAVPKIGTLF